jgi:hypothetical protein
MGKPERNVPNPTRHARQSLVELVNEPTQRHVLTPEHNERQGPRLGSSLLCRLGESIVMIPQLRHILLPQNCRSQARLKLTPDRGQ